MKKIDTIIIHCSATHAGQDIKAKDIDRMHRARGFSQIGYNYVIDLDGTVAVSYTHLDVYKRQYLYGVHGVYSVSE